MGTGIERAIKIAAAIAFAFIVLALVMGAVQDGNDRADAARNCADYGAC